MRGVSAKRIDGELKVKDFGWKMFYASTKNKELAEEKFWNTDPDG